MVDPKIMCRKHLLGEHVEHHMIVGSIIKQKSLDGYIRENCIEPLSIKSRHEELKNEMILRGYKHNSSLPEFNLNYLTNEVRNYKINKNKSLNDLISRCPECNKRFKNKI